MKKIVTNYKLTDPNSLQSPDFVGLTNEQLLLVVNATSGVLLYSPLNNANSIDGIKDPLEDAFFFVNDFPNTSLGQALQIWIDDGQSPARDDNLDTLVYFASAIHEKMPVCDTLDRMLANVVGTVTVSGTLTTVTTVTNVTSLNSMQSQPTALAPYNWASGAYHIYNGIEVT